MNFRLLTAKEYPRWYHDQLSEAFVPQERKPLPDILRLLEEGRYEVWGLFDEAELRRPVEKCDNTTGTAGLSGNHTRSS